MRRIIMLGAFTVAAAWAVATGVQAQGRPQIMLYQEDNFRGNQLVVDGAVDRLADRRFDDRASSVRVISGSWLLCQEDRFGGRCVTVNRDEPKLGRIGMDDRISSVRPVEERRDDRNDRRDRNR